MDNKMKKRIISLLPSSTEILCRLGLREKLIGVSHECDYPHSVRGLPILTKAKFDTRGNGSQIDKRVQVLLKKNQSVYEINVNLLKKLSPDLIVTQSQCELCAVSLKDVRKATTDMDTDILSLQPNTLSDVWQDFDKVAESTGASNSLKTLKLEIKKRLETISNKVKRLPKQPTVLCIEWIEPIMLGGNWIPELVNLAGGVNLISCAGEHSRIFKWEDVLRTDPDFIIIMPCGFNLKRSLSEIDYLKRQINWNELKAVKAKQVVIVDGNQYFNRPGPRLLDSIEILQEVFNFNGQKKIFNQAWKHV